MLEYMKYPASERNTILCHCPGTKCAWAPVLRVCPGTSAQRLCSDLMPEQCQRTIFDSHLGTELGNDILGA